MRQLTIKDTSETANTPLFFSDYLTNNKYHHSAKGCNVEMMLSFSPDVNNNNISIIKYCKTHRKMCSRTGWEVGWYQGTYSPAMDRFFKPKYLRCSCGRKFIKTGRYRLCPLCRCTIKPIEKHYE